MTKPKGRPPLLTRHQLTVHITEKQFKTLRQIMRRDDLRSMSAVVRQLVEAVTA